MSDVYKEDRPKLKARRFSKFEPSSSKPIVDNNEEFTKKSFKRIHTSKIDDSNRPFKQRKLSETSSYNMPPSITKNLANNRLKKLQEQIQSDLKSRDTNNPTSVSKCDKSRESPSSPLHKNSDSLIKSSNLNSTLQNARETILKKSEASTSRYLPEPKINKNLDQSFSPPRNQLCKKNLANERLQNLKKKLKNTCAPSDCTEIGTRNIQVDTSASESLHGSTKEIKENKTVCGLKRNISNITNTYDYDIFESSPKRLEVEQNVPSPLVTMKNNCGINTQFGGDTDKLHHSGVNDQSLLDTSIINNAAPCNTDIVSSTTPVSQRLLNKKNNNSTENSSRVQNDKSSTSKSTSASQRLSHIKEVNKSFAGNDNNGSKSTPDTQALQKLSASQQNISRTPVSVESRSDNFMSKMAMTATWIRNHQDISNIDARADNSSPNVSGNSLNNSTNESSNKAKFDHETEDMEWTNAEPDEEVQDTKEHIEETSKANIEVRKDPEKLKDVCIVVDTNVFISGLSKLKDIINLKTTGSFKPLIYIPWMVITELDYMKDSCSEPRLKTNILDSVKFINKALEENNPRVIGQTVFEVDKQKYVGPSPDDKIISCCLQVAEKYETVILLSNDTNLKNKAMINNLLACSMNEVMVKIMSKLSKNTKSQKILHKMGVMCSRVICECAKAAYGNVWMKMDMLSKAPWSLVECIKRFKKYWGSVFREMLMKQFTKTLDELHHLLQHNKCICDDSEEFVEFMKLCVTLCIFLKDIEECRGFVEITLNDITKLG